MSLYVFAFLFFFCCQASSRFVDIYVTTLGFWEDILGPTFCIELGHYLGIMYSTIYGHDENYY